MSEILAIDGYRRFAVAVGAAATQSVGLLPGTYAVWADVDCSVRVSKSEATGVTVDDGYPIFADAEPVLLRINDGARIGVIGTTGNLYYHRVG